MNSTAKSIPCLFSERRAYLKTETGFSLSVPKAYWILFKYHSEISQTYIWYFYLDYLTPYVSVRKS